MTNILFSTSRQWNPGDEFILFGIRRLLEKAGFRYNAVIFNRNPDIRQPAGHLNPLTRIGRPLKGESLWGSFIRKGFHDNSLKPGTAADLIDAVVFSGTPSWFSPVSKPLYSLIERSRPPVLYLGIGGLSTPLARACGDLRVWQALRDARCRIVRERSTAANLTPLACEVLPCPSLFAASTERQVTTVARIGLIYSTSQAIYQQRLAERAHEALQQGFRRLMARYEGKIAFELVAHYIDELEDAHRTYGDRVPIAYSYDAADYEDIYSRYDFVVGARVHGLAMAASLGVPGVHMAHDDRRSPMLDEFGVASLAPAEFADNTALTGLVEELVERIAERSTALSRLKAAARAKYLDLIREPLADIASGRKRPC